MSELIPAELHLCPICGQEIAATKGEFRAHLEGAHDFARPDPALEELANEIEVHCWNRELARLHAAGGQVVAAEHRRDLLTAVVIARLGARMVSCVSVSPGVALERCRRKLGIRAR